MEEALPLDVVPVVDRLRLALENRRQVWPADAPFTFVRMLAPTQVGTTFASGLVEAMAEAEGSQAVRKSLLDYYDLDVTTSSGLLRVEVKCSTESPRFRFQQVRDPRGEAGATYDWLLCIGVRPTALYFWRLTADEVASGIDDRSIGPQHGANKLPSGTYWFKPRPDRPDRYSRFMIGWDELRRWLREGTTVHG